MAFGFYGGGPYPADYDGALFFADYSPRLHLGDASAAAATLPEPGGGSDVRRSARANPVDLQIGPDGELFYVDFDGGTIRRIVYTAGNQPPIAGRHRRPDERRPRR